MSSFISISIRSARSPLSIVICSLFLVACSGSSSDNSQSTAANQLDASNGSGEVEGGMSGEVLADNTSSTDNSSNMSDVVSNEIESHTTNEPTEIVPTESEPTEIESEPVSTMPDSAAADPQTADNMDSVEPQLLLTRVGFDITVPVYVSDSLQVQLVWGDKNLSAGWVRDETWNVSDDFPTNTENLLTISFLDENGDIVLGRYETNYRTSTSPSETVAIGADQFDISSWDSDGDGVTNLDESIAGTDPLVAPNLVRTDFQITVPAVMSDALQVSLSWGDVVTTASWVGDESWTAFADLPADTGETLTVTFSDENGELPLGRYVRFYQTGNNDAENLTITADRFNTIQFDKDTDGVGNFRELLAETDPNVSDSSVPVTFTSVQEKFERCSGCHSRFRSDNLLETLNEERYVTPLEPENSFIVTKMQGSMFRYAGADMVELVRAWITIGALDN